MCLLNREAVAEFDKFDRDLAGFGKFFLSMSNIDFVYEDGKVHDPQRSEYLRTHIRGLKKANDEGVPVIGYLCWSFLDNFEWAEGYEKRFGLVYVDYVTQKRTLKDSAYTYREIIQSNGELL